MRSKSAIAKNVKEIFQVVLSCPGGMIANSIPARLVATRMRVELPRTHAYPCHAHAHGHTMLACAWHYHAHVQG